VVCTRRRVGGGEYEAYPAWRVQDGGLTLEDDIDVRKAGRRPIEEAMRARGMKQEERRGRGFVKEEEEQEEKWK
jgi:hypothetical protein